MIEFRRGNLLATEAEALVNTVNCVGVMGRGVALQFRKAFPENFRAYEAACARKELQPGSMFVFEHQHLTPPRYIINFPTKRHWKGKSRLADIEAGLMALVSTLRERGIRSVAIPPLGCGLGGLDWRDVGPMIERALAALPDVQVFLFEPGETPDARSMARVRAVPSMTAARAVLLGLMERYLVGLAEPFVTLLELHKLMYFMQESGEVLSLRYTKGPHGPYAENLRHELNEIEGHFISGYADGGDDPRKEIELIPGALADSAAFLEDHPETRERFDRVVELVSGFETSHGMELLSTVHWVVTREGAITVIDAVARTHAWNARKRRFASDQIRIAFDALTARGWLAMPQHGPV